MPSWCTDPRCKGSRAPSSRTSYALLGQTKLLYCATHGKPRTDCWRPQDEHELCKGLLDDGTRCTVSASYGIKGGERQFCDKHRDKKIHVNVVSFMCEFKEEGKDCGKRAAFAAPSEKTKENNKYTNRRPEVCGTHKKEGYVNVGDTLCSTDECECYNRATFKCPDTNKLVRCLIHRIQGFHIHENVKPCTYDENGTECKDRAYYGVKGTPKALYCHTHKKPLNVNVTEDSCVFKDCVRKANYYRKSDLVDGSLPVDEEEKINCKEGLCFEHAKDKPEYMIKRTHKKCIHDGCVLSASYRKKDSVVEFCRAHIPVNQIDEYSLKNRTCLQCDTIPVYGLPDTTKGIYCEYHALTGYINVMSRKCEDKSGCDKQACYGYKDQKERFCVGHKKPKHVDCINKTCVEQGCEDRASCGELFSEKIHCFNHRQQNEYDRTYPKCITIGCKIRPSYCNGLNNLLIRCKECKEPEDVQVIKTECEKCGITDYIALDNWCNNCSEFENVRVSKEDVIDKLLKDNNIKFRTRDSPLVRGRNQLRPDFVIDCLSFASDDSKSEAVDELDKIIVLEVDEFQHRGYIKKQEEARMIKLFYDINSKFVNKTKVIFIRYNPDSYKYLNRTYKPSETRHAKLLEVIETIKNIKLTHMLSMTQLFYDDFSCVNKIEPIDLNEAETEIKEDETKTLVKSKKSRKFEQLSINRD